jgi:predicted ATP-binding protein involved in virulence
MNKVPKRDERRDRELIADYQAKDGIYWKFTVTQLASKYFISSTRLYQILNHYKLQRRSSDVRQHASRKSDKK